MALPPWGPPHSPPCPSLLLLPQLPFSLGSCSCRFLPSLAWAVTPTTSDPHPQLEPWPSHCRPREAPPIPTVSAPFPQGPSPPEGPSLGQVGGCAVLGVSVTHCHFICSERGAGISVPSPHSSSRWPWNISLFAAHSAVLSLLTLFHLPLTVSAPAAAHLRGTENLRRRGPPSLWPHSTTGPWSCAGPPHMPLTLSPPGNLCSCLLHDTPQKGFPEVPSYLASSVRWGFPS